MTTRICHKCGKSYDNFVEFCPYCHTVNILHQDPQEKVKKEPRKGIEVLPCHKCGKVYDDNVEFCPYCHTVNRDYHPQTEIRAHKISASRVIKLICVGGIGLFFLVMLYGAISLILYHPSSPSSSSFAGNSQVVVDSQTTVAVTSTSPTLQGTNDDQTFINAVERSGADLNPIVDKLSNAINANDYSTAGTLGFDLSAHAQFWYNKIDAMQVSSNYQDQKYSYLQALLDKKANGDDWASDASHQGAKVPSTSPTVEMTYRQTITVSTTLQNTYQQTVAVQRTYQSANDDQKFIDAYISSGQELTPIITAINTELGSYHYSTVKTLGSKLSTRTQFWYNKITPIQVSSNFQEGEDAYLQALPEVKAYGDALADAMQYFQDGKGSAFTSKLDEANQHLKKATIYLNLAGAKLPV